MAEEPWNLRRVLALFKNDPSNYHETNIEVDPDAELAGAYRYIGAGGTTARPTGHGPAMMFNKIKGFSNTRVLTGIMGTRQRVAKIFDMDAKRLGQYVGQAVANPITPVITSNKDVPAHEVVKLATDADFDLHTLVPAPTNTPEDAGPYITMGLVLGSSLDGSMSDVTIHRMAIEEKDKLAIYINPGGRHIGDFAKEYEAQNKPMPITINIGLDPAITIGATFAAPTTPIGYDELGVAGAIRNQPVELVPAITVEENAIAQSEYTIEGYILPNERMQEDIHTHTGKAMPEFLGYDGVANPSLQVIKVTAVTHRSDNPIMQTTLGPSEELVSMQGITTEASIWDLTQKAIPGKVTNVYNPSSGGGKLMTILQIHKSEASDEGIQRQAALLAFSAFKELKTVWLVDDDVDIFDMDDVMWTMNTRFQGDKDVIVLPESRGHALDPSQNPKYDPASIRTIGMTSKTIIDGTVPFDMKEAFKRTQFLAVKDWKKFLK